MRIAKLVIAVATLSAFCAAAAGPSGRSSGSARASSSTSRGSTAVRTGSSIRGFAPSSALRPSRTVPAARRSLLSSGTQPSSRVTEIIRERESSGPGWIGTAFLVSLLSQHDLSASDRSWIEGRISSLRAEERGEDGGDGPDPLLPPAKPNVAVALSGAAVPLESGVPAAMELIATANGRPATSLECSVKGDTTTRTTLRRPGVLGITWTPDHPGVYILDCTADGHHERRLLRVAAHNEARQ